MGRQEKGVLPMKKWIKMVIVAVVIAAALNFTWEYFKLVEIADNLALDVSQAKQQVGQLTIQLDDQVLANKKIEAEKVFLGQELASAREEISRSQAAIDKLEQDLDGLKIHLSSLERKNILQRLLVESLASNKKRLEEQLDQLVKEKENLQARFSSLSELKKVIRYLKDNPSAQKEFVEQDFSSSSAGNAGFLMKQGETTYRPSINVQVLPAP